MWIVYKQVGPSFLRLKVHPLTLSATDPLVPLDDGDSRFAGSLGPRSLSISRLGPLLSFGIASLWWEL